MFDITLNNKKLQNIGLVEFIFDHLPIWNSTSVSPPNQN